MSKLGQKAAECKWILGERWSEVFARWPNEPRERIRSAARRYKRSHPDEFQKPDAQAPEFVEDGNTATATVVSEQIQTLDELIEACKINLDVWKCTQFKPKAYPGWRADTDKDLSFDEGKITGYVRSQGIYVKQLWSLTATFVRREPKPLCPTFAPIQVLAPAPAPTTTKPAGALRALLFSDTHIGFRKELSNAKLIPFHDRSVLSRIRKIARLYRPHVIGVLGDLFDLARWSRKFAAEPEFYWTTQPALLEGHWLLAGLRRDCPDASIEYLEGNHEVRLPSYVNANVNEAMGLSRVGAHTPILSLPYLLGLDDISVTFHGGYDDDTAIFEAAPWMRWAHGNVARKPGATSWALLSNATRWLFYGHTHRTELVSKTLDNGATIVAMSFGCTCHTDGRLPGSGPGDQWQKRIGLLEYEAGAATPSITVLSMEGDTTLWNGQQITGDDYVDELRELYPDWNW